MASAGGDVTYVSRGLRERALGDSWLAFVHEADRERVLAQWRKSYESGDPYRIEYRLLNADCTYHWSLVSALPVLDDDGDILRWVGVISDVQDRYEAEEKRERDTRERKRIEEGLRLLSRTGAAVVESLDYKQTLHNIASAFVDGFAAYCLIDVIPAGGRWERTTVHRDPAFVPLFHRISRPSGNHPIARAIDRGESTVTAIDDTWYRNLDAPSNADRLDIVRQLRVRSIICVPVKTPSGKTVGALTCALDETNDREDYAPQDLEFVEEVARRAGAAIANAQLFERESRIADQLQAASLPATLPMVDGIAIDAAYRPGSDEANIGGDWYDAFVLADGSLVITVGDVIGHGLQAAISMTKLRLAMQSAAIANADPNLMLRVADATIRMASADTFATAIAAVYDPATRLLTFASAGHPNPILRNADGTLVEFATCSPMIGLRNGDENETTSVVIPAGSTLVFYTDGLIEVVREIDEGLRRLTQTVREGAFMRASRPADAIVREVLCTDQALDDIAVIVVRFSPVA